MRPSRLPTGSTPRQISSPAEKRTSRSEGRSGWIRAARISRSSELATSGAPWSCSTASRRARAFATPGGVPGGGPPSPPAGVPGKGGARVEELKGGRLPSKPPGDLRLREIAESEQQIVQPVRTVRRPAQPLGRLLVLLE